MEKLSTKEQVNEFIAFLQANNALYAFCNNLRNNITYGIRNSVVEWLYYCDVEDFVLGAFPWSDTDEGLDYWSIINKKWENIIK